MLCVLFYYVVGAIFLKHVAISLTPSDTETLSETEKKDDARAQREIREDIKQANATIDKQAIIQDPRYRY